MKLSDRLTRAGIVFIMLGTVAAILPGTGSALATTDTCNSVQYTFGETVGDTKAADTFANNSGSTITLSTFSGNKLDATGVITQTSTTPSGLSVSPVGAGGNTITVTDNGATMGSTITFSASFGNDPNFHPTYTLTAP